VLHDPEKSDSADRVAWTSTRNLVSDASEAWFEMFLTHRDQAALKEAAGIDARGRKNTNPVLHFTLSWPHSETPSDEHMHETAVSALKALGLDEHQAVMAAHTDKKHSHVHVVVNTVHPITGRTADLKFNKLEFSRWAEAYEREHGIHCEQRVANNADRDTMRQLRAVEKNNGTEPGLYVPIKDRSPSRDEWLAQDDGARGKDDPVPRLLTALTRHHSTFTRQDLAREVSLLTKDEASFRDLMGRVEGSPELARLAGTDRLSTQTMVRAEALLAATVDAMAQDHTHPVNAKGLRLRARAESLTPAQAAALVHVTNPEAISCVTGFAGAGKSTMLGVAREVWEASGYTVRGAALAGIAAQGLQSGSGITSSSIAALQWGLENDTITFTKRDILVIDEAGMVGSRQMQQVVSAARLGGAKVVLVGDPEQLQSIEAGAAYRAVAERVGTASIEEVRRQREAWQQEATKALATGRTREAIGAYARAGRIHGHDTKEAAASNLIKSWSTGLRESVGAPDLILAPTRADVSMLNTSAREAMQKAGRLGESRPLRAIEEVIGKPAKSFNLDVAIGDRLLFTKNDNRLGVRNGTLGTLEAFGAGCLVVRLDNRERVVVALDRYRNIAHGYAMTVHKAQGVTVDRAHVLAGRSMDRHMAYVALSRHRDHVALHYGRDQFASQSALVAGLSRRRLKDTTLDYTALDHTVLGRTGHVSLSKEKRSDRIRTQAIDWRKRNPEKDFGLEM
jgi:Ti-type conjugative transfer relaxase TraA